MHLNNEKQVPADFELCPIASPLRELIQSDS